MKSCGRAHILLLRCMHLINLIKVAEAKENAANMAWQKESESVCVDLCGSRVSAIQTRLANGRVCRSQIILIITIINIITVVRYIQIDRKDIHCSKYC